MDIIQHNIKEIVAKTIETNKTNNGKYYYREIVLIAENKETIRLRLFADKKSDLIIKLNKSKEDY